MKIKSKSITKLITLLYIITSVLLTFPFNVGYSDESTQIKNLNCFQTFPFETEEYENVSKLEKITKKELISLFSSSTKVKSGFEIYDLSSEKQFLKRFFQETEETFNLNMEFNEESTIENYYHFKYSKKIRFNIPRNTDILSQIGKFHYKKENFGLTCGNNLIKEATVGAILVFSTKVEFSNYENELVQTYIRTHTDNDMQKNKEILLNIVNQHGISGKLHIKALQIGGNAHFLPKILLSEETSNENPYVFVSCDLRQIDKCMSISKGVHRYAQNDFFPSVSKNTEDVIRRLVLLRNDYKTESITEYGLNYTKTIRESDVLIRNKLEMIFKETVYYISTISYLLNKYENDIRKAKGEGMIIKMKEVKEKAVFIKRKFDDPDSNYFVDVKNCYDNPLNCMSVMSRLYNIECAIEKSLYNGLEKLEKGDSKWKIRFYCGSK